MKRLPLYLLCLLFSAHTFAADEGGIEISKDKCDKSKPVSGVVKIEKAVDGDTVYILSKDGKRYSVRMIGIDTPETHYMGETQGEWGDRAAERLAEILKPGTEATLELSPSICDSYGRVLAHIFVGRKHVNLQMAKEGLAVNYCIYPSVAYCEEIGSLVTEAINERKGMFSDSNVELPYDFRRRISNREPTSKVGNIRTKLVYGPKEADEVPVGDRIFFSDGQPLPAPYKMAR